MDNSYDSVFDIEPRLVIDEAKAEQELDELGEEMDVYLAHRLPPYPASDPVVYTREESDEESSGDEEMDENRGPILYTIHFSSQCTTFCSLFVHY